MLPSLILTLLALALWTHGAPVPCAASERSGNKGDRP